MMIDDISLTPLNIITTPGGDVLHALKNNEHSFMGFGEAYFSEVGFKKIKAWKRHTLMTLNIIVPIGKINFVLFDDRLGHNKMRLHEVVMSRERYMRLTIPPMIWVGFQGLSKETSLLLNVADIPHNPEEVEKEELEKFTYNWSFEI
jgi:dTDP-4-dehydrorhamnose 3,5-epimerase